MELDVDLNPLLKTNLWYIQPMQGKDGRDAYGSEGSKGAKVSA